MNNFIKRISSLQKEATLQTTRMGENTERKNENDILC